MAMQHPSWSLLFSTRYTTVAQFQSFGVLLFFLSFLRFHFISVKFQIKQQYILKRYGMGVRLKNSTIQIFNNPISLNDGCFVVTQYCSIEGIG
jgi:hypothetical protein